MGMDAGSEEQGMRGNKTDGKIAEFGASFWIGQKVQGWI